MGLLHYVAVHILYLVIPISSILHWLITSKDQLASDNFIKAWSITYPLSGLNFITVYFWIIRDVIIGLKREYIDRSTWEKRIDDTLNIYVESEN